MSTETRAKPRKAIVVFVNNRPVELPGRKVTGAEIKQAAEVPPEFILYGPKGGVIGDDEHVRVHPNERFTAISGQDVS